MTLVRPIASTAPSNSTRHESHLIYGARQLGDGRCWRNARQSRTNPTDTQPEGQSHLRVGIRSKFNRNTVRGRVFQSGNYYIGAREIAVPRGGVLIKILFAPQLFYLINVTSAGLRACCAASRRSTTTIIPL